VNGQNRIDVTTSIVVMVKIVIILISVDCIVLKCTRHFWLQSM